MTDGGKKRIWPARTGSFGANRSMTDVGRLLGPTVDYSKLVGPTIDISKFVGPTIDVSKFVGPTIDVSKFVGPTIDVSKFVGPTIDTSKFVGPTIDTSKFVGPTVDISKFVGPAIDWSKLVGPKIDWSKFVGATIDLSHVVGATLRDSKALRGVEVSGAVATSSVLPDIDVPELAGDMTVGDLLGDRIDMSADVGSDLLVTDLLGERLEAAALLGDHIDAHTLDTEARDVVDPHETALVAAFVARVDELEMELGGRLASVEASQTWRRQMVIILLGAFVSLALTIAVAQMAPSLLSPEGSEGRAGRSASENVRPAPNTQPTDAGDRLERASPDRIEDINVFVQDRLKSRNLDEIRAVEAARWLDDAGLLSDSSSRPGSPLRRMLRAGLIAGAQQRPAKPHGRWFIVALSHSGRR